MEPFSAWILPLLLSGAALWGARRRVDVYDALVTGGKSGLQVAVSILPALAALLTAVYMLRASGALDALTALLAPALTALGVPPETAPLLVIRPLSWLRRAGCRRRHHAPVRAGQLHRALRRRDAGLHRDDVLHRRRLFRRGGNQADTLHHSCRPDGGPGCLPGRGLGRPTVL